MFETFTCAYKHQIVLAIILFPILVWIPKTVYKLTENWYDVTKHVLGLHLNFVSCKMSFVSYSNTYFGEYPLSFAACLGLEDMVRYFIVKGACPNKQDTNGNTVLHMMVIHNRMVCK